MSILDNKIYNPAKFYEWAGSTGHLRTYNKETKTEILVDELEFIVLDQAATLKGWDDSSSSSYWSNEIKDSKDEFVLRNKKGIVAKGTYNEVKDTPGVKFCKVVYAYDVKNKEVIGLLLHGSSVTVAIDAKIKDGAKYSFVKNPEIQKKGATKYYVPIIKAMECPSEELELARGAYVNTLKPYLDQYYAEKPKPLNLGEMEEVHLRDLNDINIDALPAMPF